MFGLNISLFGRFQMRYGDEIIDFDNRKLKEMLGYLLLYRHRPHPREALGTLLWPDSSTSQTKKYLRQALWQIQSSFNAYSGSEKIPLLTVETHWIQIHPETSFQFDVEIFEAAFNCVQGIQGHELDEQGVETLRAAVKLYRGDLLEGWYQEWCLFERERLQQMYLVMLDKLTAYSEAHQSFEEGLIYGMIILRYDQAREHTHRQMMRLQYLSGNRTGALRQYKQCKTILEDELGVQPTEQTEKLYEQIQADHLGELDLPSPQFFSQPKLATIPLVEMLNHLRRLQVMVNDIQDQLYQQIQTFETMLKK